MVFLARDAGFVFYPGLAFADIGPDHSFGAMINGCVHEEEENEKTNIALAKYSARNFVYQPPPSGHVCRKDPLCPHTMRNLLDHHGFSFPLRSDMTKAEIARAVCRYASHHYVSYSTSNLPRLGTTTISCGEWVVVHAFPGDPPFLHLAM